MVLKGKLTDPIKYEQIDAKMSQASLTQRTEESSTFQRTEIQLWQRLPPQSWNRGLAEGQPGTFECGWLRPSQQRVREDKQPGLPLPALDSVSIYYDGAVLSKLYAVCSDLMPESL